MFALARWVSTVDIRPLLMFEKRIDVVDLTV